MSNYLNETTFTDELIAFLLSCRSNSIRKSILWERVSKRRNISKSVYNQNLYRLKERGLIVADEDLYKLSKKGVTYYRNPYKLIKEKLVKKNKIIIIFDIPENKKRVREWIRKQIKFWDFKMIQKSVWIGYGPLPKEFSRTLKVLKCEDGVKIFNVQSKHSINTSLLSR